MITPFFCIWTSQLHILQKGIYNIYNPLSSPHSLKTSPGDTWTQSLRTNFHSFNPLQYESKCHKQIIPESSCARKETVDIDILVTSRNGHRKIMQSIRIMSGPPSRKKKWNQLSQFWRISTKVLYFKPCHICKQRLHTNLHCIYFVCIYSPDFTRNILLAIVMFTFHVLFTKSFVQFLIISQKASESFVHDLSHQYKLRTFEPFKSLNN